MIMNLFGLGRVIKKSWRRSTSSSVARKQREFQVRRSYSIEAEDLLIETILYAVLKQYQPSVYLDIGAAHPIQHSNTYYFYKRGWTGVCVEPNPEFYALYATHRPRDKVFNVGISPDQSGTLRYHRFKSQLINGFYGQEMIDRHVARGEDYLGHSDVQCLNIGDFLREQINQPIDVLNIDVETLDARILGAWDWGACRPVIICAEIHTSDIKTMLASDVATVLANAGYSAMSRGWLSTIFVANERLGCAV